MAGLAAGAALLPRGALAASPRESAGADPERRVRMLHTHTGETIDVTYFESGQYVDGALGELDHFLRDFRTGDVHAIDPGALDIAVRVARLVGAPAATFHIICGYRSPQTNAALRARGRGVASHSMHLVGKAIDLRIPGVSTARLRDAALSLRAGGVGYYPTSDFVHVDTGPVRHWAL